MGIQYTVIEKSDDDKFFLCETNLDINKYAVVSGSVQNPEMLALFKSLAAAKRAFKESVNG